MIRTVIQPGYWWFPPPKPPARRKEVVQKVVEPRPPRRTKEPHIRHYKNQEVDVQIMETLKGGSMTALEIARRTGRTKNFIRQFLRVATKHHWIKCSVSGRKQDGYKWELT